MPCPVSYFFVYCCYYNVLCFCFTGQCWAQLWRADVVSKTSVLWSGHRYDSQPFDIIYNYSGQVVHTQTQYNAVRTKQPVLFCDGKTAKDNDNPGVVLIICHRVWYAHLQAQQSCSHPVPVNNNSCVISILSHVFFPLISFTLFQQKFIVQSQCRPTNVAKKLVMQTYFQNVHVSSKSTPDSIAAGASLQTLLKKFTALPRPPSYFWGRKTTYRWETKGEGRIMP